MTDTPEFNTSPSRLWALFGLGSAAIAALGAYGSGLGLWHFTTGFLVIGLALLLALIALGGGLVMAYRGRWDLWLGAGMAAALGLIGIIGLQIWRGVEAPPIHDVSTDLANPPRFVTLNPRDDLYAGLDGGRTEWQRLHRAAYADIAPVRLAMPVDQALERVSGVIAARGWDVATMPTGSNCIEATDTVSPFRFKDDIVVVFTPDGDEGARSGTLINIRSVSRVGMSDLGVNARRVRALMADIRALEASP